jgi:hypothetical protein
VYFFRPSPVFLNSYIPLSIMTDRHYETTQESISTDPAPMFDLWSKSVEPACGSWHSVQMQKPIQLISANLLSLFRSWVDQRIGCRRYRYEARFLGVALAPPFFAKKLPASSPSFAVYKSLTSLLNNLLCTMLFYRQSLTPINTLTQSATHSLIGLACSRRVYNSAVLI